MSTRQVINRILIVTIVALKVLYPQTNKESLRKYLDISDIYEGKQLLWERMFASPHSRISISKNSNDFVLIEQGFDNKKVQIEYFNKNGELQWKIDNSVSKFDEISIRLIGVYLSDNGELIMVRWGGGYEYVQTQFFNRSGKLLYTVPANTWGGRYRLSPDGKYFYCESIYNTGGEKININIPQIYKEGEIKVNRFINNHLIVIRVRRHFIKPRFTTESRYKWFLYDLILNQILKESEEIIVPRGEHIYIYSLENHFLVVNTNLQQSFLYDSTGTLLWFQPEVIKLSENAIIDFATERIINIKRSVITAYDLHTGLKIFENTHFENLKKNFPMEPRIFNIYGRYVYAVASKLEHNQYTGKEIPYGRVFTLFWNIDEHTNNFKTENEMILIPGNLKIKKIDIDKFKIEYFK